MIESIKVFLVNFEFTSFLALLLYWTPLAVCAGTYLFRCIGDYKRDIKKCNEKYYVPELTIGVIFERMFCSFTPIINVFAMVFDCLSSVVKWIETTFNIPLVKHRPDLSKEK